MKEENNFKAVLKQVLTVSKEEMRRRLAEEKRSKIDRVSPGPVARAKRG